MSKKLNLTLHVWRQKGPSAAGGFVKYPANDIDDHMSFLEMLDVVNEGLIARGETEIEEADCVDISFPTFWQDLERLRVQS